MKPISRNEFNAWVDAQGGYLAANFWTYFWFDQGRQLKALILRAVEALERAAEGTQGPAQASKRPYSKPAMVCLDVPSETNERVRFLIELACCQMPRDAEVETAIQDLLDAATVLTVVDAQRPTQAPFA